MCARTIVALGLVLVCGPLHAQPFFEKMAEIDSKRQEFARSLENSQTKAKVKEAARKYLVKTIIEDIIPAWYGTPWHMGKDDDAEYPHQKGKRISCSYFVTAVLQNVGFVFDSRKKWANSRALYIQTSLTDKDQVQRFYGISAKGFSRKLLELKEGLYLVGLNCHIGFIWIKDHKAWFIHSNYVDPQEGVVREPVATSHAIINSEKVGYWVTPLLNDDRLLEQWLFSKKLILQKMDLRYLY
jgi:hypothetical protein